MSRRKPLTSTRCDDLLTFLNGEPSPAVPSICTVLRRFAASLTCQVARQWRYKLTARFHPVRRRIICESFSAIYEWWRISLCSTIVCCRGLRPKTTVC
jgi:hypothetical protein